MAGFDGWDEAAQANERGVTRQLPTVWLTSGQQFQIQEIELYQTKLLQRSAQCRAEAAKALGGAATSWGVIGSPGLTFAAEAAAVGLISGILANSAQKAAVEKLNEAVRYYENAKKTAELFKAAKISNLATNDPAAWTTESDPRPTRVSLYDMSHDDRRKFCEKHGIKFGIVMDGEATVPLPVHFSHSGDDFVRVRTETGILSFRWSSVACYQPPER